MRHSTERTGYEEVFGTTPDISEWLDFEFYDLVWYWDREHADMAEENRKFGRWLGISHRVGSDLTYWILTGAGNVLSRTTVCHVLRKELLKPENKERFEEFNEAVRARMDDETHVAGETGGRIFYIQDVDTADEERGDGNTPTDQEYGEMIEEERPDDDEVIMDKYIGAELAIVQQTALSPLPPAPRSESVQTRVNECPCRRR